MFPRPSWNGWRFPDKYDRNRSSALCCCHPRTECDRPDRGKCTPVRNPSNAVHRSSTWGCSGWCYGRRNRCPSGSRTASIPRSWLLRQSSAGLPTPRRDSRLLPNSMPRPNCYAPRQPLQRHNDCLAGWTIGAESGMNRSVELKPPLLRIRVARSCSYDFLFLVSACAWEDAPPECFHISAGPQSQIQSLSGLIRISCTSTVKLCQANCCTLLKIGGRSRDLYTLQVL